MEIAELKRLRIQYIDNLKYMYEEYIKQYLPLLQKINRLRYISNGKRGWNGLVDYEIKHNVFGLGNRQYIHLNTGTLSDDAENPYPCYNDFIFDVEPDNLDFKNIYEYYYNKAYIQCNEDEVSQTLILDEFLQNAYVIGLDLTFDEVLAHYKGIQHYVYTICKNEDEFNTYKTVLFTMYAKELLINFSR